MDISEKNEAKAMHRISRHRIVPANVKVFLSVAMRRVTLQNGRKLTFNPIYFANEFDDSRLFLHLSISFSLGNKYAVLKKILYIQFFKKLKNHNFFCVERNYLQNIFQICLFIT